MSTQRSPMMPPCAFRDGKIGSEAVTVSFLSHFSVTYHYCPDHALQVLSLVPRRRVQKIRFGEEEAAQ